MQFDFYFDVGSPNAYLSHTVIPQIEKRTNTTCRYIPILLGGVFKATNNRSPMEAFAGIDNKLSYIRLETERFMSRYNVKGFQRNPHFPVNTLMMMRGAIYAETQPFFDKYVDVTMRAMWQEQRKMDEFDVFKETLVQNDLPADEIIQATQDQNVKKRLIENVDHAVALGIFGSPSFIVNGELYFGKDTLPTVEEILSK